MMRSYPRVLIQVIVAAAFGSAGLFAACTDSYRSNVPGEAGGGGTGPSSGPGGGGTGGQIIPDGGTCELTCSNDLKKVINCVGAVIEDCVASGQACANAQCVADPCQAAETSKSSYGCDYWAVKTAQRVEASGACFAVFIANTWPANVHIEVEYGGMPLNVADFAGIPSGQGQSITYTPYDDTVGLAENEVAILFLSQDPNGGLIQCPLGPAISAETGLVGTGRGDAFHIRTDYPVVAYQIAPFGGGQTNFTSATLLLPTSAWDVNYMAVNAYKSSPLAANGFPSLSIVAREDDTNVTILPKVDILAGQGVPGAMANMPVTYTMNAGEFLQITQQQELTGSVIESDKPIGLWGASACMTVPDNVNYCDSGQQQIAPVKALGHEYAAVRYRGRNGMDEAPPWRLVGVVDGTELEWVPEPPTGAPETLNRGDVVEFTSTGQFVVRSQDNAHPFYLGSYMTGGATFGDEGDPEWVNVIPPSQFLDNYVFFTDPTYPETSLVVIRTRSKIDGSFAPVELDCAGELTGWQDLGDYQYTRVSLVTGNFQSGSGNCENGPHRISSTLPFGVTVWGWGDIPQYTRVSYAYPAGAGFQPINEVVVPPQPE